MPFYYDVKVPIVGSSAAGETYVFVKWVTAGKAYIKALTALAIVRSGDVSYLLRNAGEGFFTPWAIHEGDKILPGQPIGRITTDGELIPYGRPYVTFEVAASGQQ